MVDEPPTWPSLLAAPEASWRTAGAVWGGEKPASWNYLGQQFL